MEGGLRYARLFREALSRRAQQAKLSLTTQNLANTLRLSRPLTFRNALLVRHILRSNVFCGLQLNTVTALYTSLYIGGTSVSHQPGKWQMGFGQPLPLQMLMMMIKSPKSCVIDGNIIAYATLCYLVSNGSLRCGAIRTEFIGLSIWQSGRRYACIGTRNSDGVPLRAAFFDLIANEKQKTDNK